jgi:hypothetical protein
MKIPSINKILFLVIFIMIKQKADPSIMIHNEKAFYINTIEKVKENKDAKESQKISTAFKAIAVGVALAEIYHYCINKYQKSTNKIDTKEKKEKNIFEKIQDKIGESAFGNFISSCYSSIVFKNDISSLLNNPRVMELCKEELKEKLLTLEQAENKLFLDTLFITMGLRKTYKTLKKAYEKCLNTTLPIIGLLFGVSYMHYSLNESIKTKVGKEAEKVDFLKNREAIKSLVTTSACVSADIYVTTPIANFFIYCIEASKELVSKQHTAIKKGKSVKLFSAWWTSNDSKEIETNKEIYEGGKSLLKTVTTVLKIFKNIHKFSI